VNLVSNVNNAEYDIKGALRACGLRPSLSLVGNSSVAVTVRVIGHVCLSRPYTVPTIPFSCRAVLGGVDIRVLVASFAFYVPLYRCVPSVYTKWVHQRLGKTGQGLLSTLPDGF
jgi:hypothetical protein